MIITLPGSQRGSLIIVTLWTITLIAILVAVLASQTRLSAEVAYAHKQDLKAWAAQESAINQAEMEVMMEKMPLPPDSQKNMDVSAAALNQILKSPVNRYNGQLLTLAYPQAENIEVRIYEHAGKINLREISRPRLRALLEKKLGGVGKADPDQLDSLMDAWNDWIDLNDGKNPRGAEKDYYLSLPVPYAPRNGALETVEEILAIKGFAEVFADVDLDAAFTLYGDSDQVNFNVATVEALRLLPGLDDEQIGKILAWRKDHDMTGLGDVSQLITPEAMNEVRGWINNRKTTDHYTIMVINKPGAKAEANDADKQDDKKADKQPVDDAGEKAWPETAYAEIVRAQSPTERPQVLKINPYQKVPMDPTPLIEAAEAKQ